jgi:hypothetical protein
MREVRDAISAILDTTTLDDIVHKVDSVIQQRDHVMMYDI